MLKSVFPSNIGHPEISFSSTAAEEIKTAGFEGYWFDPAKDFILPPEQMKLILKENGLKAAGMELPVEFREDEEVFERDLNYLDSIAEQAKRIGITRTITWIVPSSDTLPFEKNFALHVERLRRVLDILARHGISLGLEFQGPKSLRKDRKYWFVHTLDGMKALIAAIDRPNCGLVLDVWHWDLANMEAFDFKEIASADEIITVHMNDAPEGLKDIEYQDLVRRLPGSTGILRTKEFVSGLKDLGYQGPVYAEPFVEELSDMPFIQALETVSRSLDSIL